MAKVQKYEDDLLMEAVVQYAKVQRGKIKVTELAEWASKNVPGLSGAVREDFVRPVFKKDPKTDKVVRQCRPSEVKIREINEARDNQKMIRRNPLLAGATLESFFGLPLEQQRTAVEDARVEMETLCRENSRLQKENRDLLLKNDKFDALTKELSEKLSLLRRQQEKIARLQARLIAKLDEAEAASFLSEIGFSQDGVDLNAFYDTLKNGLEEAYDVDANIAAVKSKLADDFMEDL